MGMDETLDLRGLKCPLPALLAKKAMAKLPPGTSLTVLADRSACRGGHSAHVPLRRPRL